MATFAIAINTLQVLKEKGVISAEDARVAISRAKRVIENQVDNFPDKDATHEAIRGIEMAEQMFRADTVDANQKLSH
ncbi:hypothetical protein [Propionivibrio sp.]|uniref:hypothetical protein n=1 Tax=Propionivibrio sp. TaxID=2212460 RepID=UPI003BF0A1BB